MSSKMRTYRRRKQRAARRDFHRFRSEAKSVPMAISFNPGGDGGMFGQMRDYTAFARESYVRNVIAFRAIDLIAGGFRQLPWFVTRNDEIVDDPNDDLVKVITRPNPWQGTGAFFEAVAAYRLCMGNTYIKRTIAQSEATDGVVPRTLELYNLRPDRTAPKYDPKTGLLLGYTHTRSANHKEFYPILDMKTMQSNVLHLKTFNPLDERIGLSPVEPGSYSIDQHNAAAEWNYRLLRNGARPMGILENRPPDGVSAELDDPDRERLKKQLNEKHVGPENAGKFLLLEGYLQWKQMGMSPVDMDFGNIKSTSAREIGTAWGVAPMLLGDTADATFSNYKEARLALWEDIIIPLAYYYRDELNHWLTPGFGDDVRLDIDIDAIPAIAEKRFQLWQSVETSSSLTINEKREVLDYDDIEGGDTLLIPFGLTPLESVVEDGESEEETPDIPSDVIEEVEDMEPEEAAKLAGYTRG